MKAVRIVISAIIVRHMCFNMLNRGSNLTGYVNRPVNWFAMAYSVSRTATEQPLAEAAGGFPDTVQWKYNLGY